MDLIVDILQNYKNRIKKSIHSYKKYRQKFKFLCDLYCNSNKNGQHSKANCVRSSSVTGMNTKVLCCQAYDCPTWAIKSNATLLHFGHGTTFTQTMQFYPQSKRIFNIHLFFMHFSNIVSIRT